MKSLTDVIPATRASYFAHVVTVVLATTALLAIATTMAGSALDPRTDFDSTRPMIMIPIPKGS